jgi:DNA-binding transcriptional ArsR family regulator
MLLHFNSTAYAPHNARRKIFYGRQGAISARMHYNELKLLILRILSGQGLIDSSTVAAKLDAGGTELDVHAVRMALMRYYRQGLLRRERRLGMYVYALSDKGIGRWRWLESLSRDGAQKRT